MRCFLDPASHTTFISRKLQRNLDLPTYSSPTAKIVGLNGAVVANSTKLSLGSIDPSFKLCTEAYVVEKVIGPLRACLLAKYADFDAPELPFRTHMDLLLGGSIGPDNAEF